MPPVASLPLAAPSRSSEISWGNIVRLLLAGALLTVCWNILSDPDAQGDFRIFHAAAKLWSQGLNPYDPTVVAPFSPHHPDLAYVYPPDTLWVFRPFNALPFAPAAHVYLLLQIGLIAALYACWQRVFLPPADRDSPWFAAFCFFGLGGTLTLDLSVGNVSLIEQAFLWFGLAAYLRGRHGWFCVLLWLAAAFKLTLLAFSGLLLLGPVRHWEKFVLVWAAMAGRLALGYLASPVLFVNFIYGFGRMQANTGEGGRNNPSLPEFLSDFVRLTLAPDDAGQTRLIVLVLYALAAVAVFALTWRTWRALERRTLPDAGRGESGVLLVCLFAVAYALLIPRLKDYSCILLLLPVWRLAKFSLAGRSDAWLALIAVGCLSNQSQWLPIHAAYVLFWRYQVLALAFIAWAFFVHAILRGRVGSPAASAASSPR